MGYMMIDDRASGGEFVEFDTAQCRHCQRHMKIFRRQPQGAYCLNCAGPVCDQPPCNTDCRPFMKMVEQAEARAAHRAAFARAAGLQE